MPFKIADNTIRLLISAGFLILIALFLFRYSSCDSDHPDPGGDRGSADSLFYWKNKYNELVASQKGTEAEFSVQDPRIKRIIDSVARVYGTKPKNVKELVITTTEGASDVPVSGPVIVGTDSGEAEYVTGDACTWMEGSFISPYYNARVRLGDSSYMRLQTRDTITYLWKTVKQGNIFNRKTYLQLDINHANPDIIVTNTTAYRELPKPKQFSIGPEAQILYLDGKFRPLAGLELQRETGRWNVSISGGKDFTNSVDVKTNPWYGQGKLSFKLIRL